ncbi:hypothetical protein [Sediminitomix flava]|uniref:Uncharacterized protein n=1 Tax=Sediminitomix flava TaxID=379075 RepID=A0A315Z7B3_SEDFL|nr:hypothetical protein [Sediminitomix flava]PWJ40233.1 hypothetical protein BC781_105301 [Sediminitomix flava]
MKFENAISQLNEDFSTNPLVLTAPMGHAGSNKRLKDLADAAVEDHKNTGKSFEVYEKELISLLNAHEVKNIEGLTEQFEGFWEVSSN